jgi:predicted MPP superfamily phosphohydrolase
VKDLPAALDGMTIAHVSDMHAGRFTRSSVLQKMIGAVNDLRCDLVLVTGDLINGATARAAGRHRHGARIRCAFRRLHGRGKSRPVHRARGI